MIDIPNKNYLSKAVRFALEDGATFLGKGLSWNKCIKLCRYSDELYISILRGATNAKREGQQMSRAGLA
jgi:hypothetical protein